MAEVNPSKIHAQVGPGQPEPGKTARALRNQALTAAAAVASGGADHYSLPSTLARSSGHATPAPTAIANNPRRTGRRMDKSQPKVKPSRPIPTVPLS